MSKTNVRMKKLLLFVFVCSMGLQAAARDKTLPVPKLSPLTKQYMLEWQKATDKSGPMKGYMYKTLANGNKYLSGLVKVIDAEAAGNGLKSIGAYVGTKAGDIWTVQVPFDKVETFVQISGLLYIQLDEPLRPALDWARKTTRVDSVHGGYNLPMRYSGLGVIVGIVDFGFDYNHPTMYDTMGTAYRIKRVWELNSTGTPPTGFTYGKEIADTNAIKTEGTDNADQMHGTSVAGMAAGSGFGSNPSNSRFRGMAYDAEMVMVGVRRDSIEDQWRSSGFSDFVDAVNYIFTYATSVGKPCVVNISWGSQSGPHDGTSLTNQAFNNLTGPGKILVMSAGNEGEEKLHLAKTFTAGDTVINTFLRFSDTVYKRTWVDVWGDTGKTFCMKATLYHNGVAGNSTNFVCIDNNSHSFVLLNNNGDSCWATYTTSSSEFNDKPRMTLDIYNKGKDSIGISVKGTDGSIDMWDESYYYGFPYRYFSEFDSLGFNWAVNGNNTSTTSDMGAADSVLLVGAYASKVNFMDINGNNWSYNAYVGAGKLVPFSSRGPRVNGLIKPDITAPGITIATSASSYDTSYTPTGSNSSLVISEYTHPVTSRKYYYAEFSGTSASAPAASGIVALMLQVNPNLGPSQVNNIIATTAIEDSYTGNLPNEGTVNWGHGKINAYGAIKKILQQLSTYDYKGRKLDCVLFPNPNDGTFTIDYTGNKDEELTVSVLNITGSVVAVKNWHVNAGSNITDMNVSGLPKGTYIVRVSAKDGSVNIKTVLK